MVKLYDYETLNRLKDHPVWSNVYKRLMVKSRTDYYNKVSTFIMRFGEISLEHKIIIAKKVADEHGVKYYIVYSYPNHPNPSRPIRLFPHLYSFPNVSIAKILLLKVTTLLT